MFRSILVILIVCCFQQTALGQLGGQLVSLITTQINDGNTTLVSMSLPKFTIQSTQQTSIKSHYLHPSTVNRNNNLIYLFADSILYNIDRQSLKVSQTPMTQNIVKMENNPKSNNLVVLIENHKYFLATISQVNGQINYVMEMDRNLNQTFSPYVASGYSTYDFNRNIFYLSVSDGGWIPGHNRILKFDINNQKISAIVLDDEYSEFADFNYDPTLDLVIGLYYPISADNAVQFITIDASTSKIDKFSVPGLDLQSNHALSHSSLNGYYYILADTGKVFVVDVKARKLVLSTTNPISANNIVQFSYYFE